MSRKNITNQLVCLAYLFSKYESSDLLHVKYPQEYLQKWTNESKKVCYRAMERAFNEGFIEYGVSLQSGWLTDSGKDLILSVELLEEALKCIARLTPFPIIDESILTPDENRIINNAIEKAAKYADSAREKIRNAL